MVQAVAIFLDRRPQPRPLKRLCTKPQSEKRDAETRRHGIAKQQISEPQIMRQKQSAAAGRESEYGFVGRGWEALCNERYIVPAVLSFSTMNGLMFSSASQRIDQPDDAVSAADVK
ncbi:MAG TPA: hypothetical protein VGF56_05105 [Rhizomicrobium sp.]